MVVDYRDAMPLPEDEYYDHQLVGLEVWDPQSQTPVGVLTEVLHLPANAVFTVVREDGSEVLIPALKQVVRRVDVEKGAHGNLAFGGNVGMRIDIVTIFPQVVSVLYDYSVIGRAIAGGILTVNAVNPRDFTEDKHRQVDDYPYGGGGRAWF